jgi:[acyl-carrier-protein] S-malonyltransferase
LKALLVEKTFSRPRPVVYYSPRLEPARNGMELCMGEWRRERYALVFPGQGAQFVGMGGALIEASPAAAVVKEADAVLGFSLSGLMANGPAEELEDTHNAQPAILAISIAAQRAVESALGEPLHPAMVAGHSLGEFSALVAAGVLEYSDALRLVRERGRIMKEAGSTNPGAMAAVLGLDDETLAEVCREASGKDGVVVVANRNCPGQTVISGNIAALERASELARERGAKRVARLGVSIGSHSPLMATASAEFGRHVSELALADPQVPVIANGSAKPMTSRDEVAAEISAQMAAPVDWTGSVETMLGHGVRTFIELGPGAVIAGLIKRIDREATVLGVSDLGLGLPSTAK